jgi:hypothetical protein
MERNIIEEIILVDDSVTGELNIAKNSAIKHIMRAIELVIPRDHPKKRDIRSIVLDEINAYHRIVCKLMSDTAKDVDKCGS